MSKEIYALGVGHNTPVFIELAESCGFKISGLYHYNEDKTGSIDHGFKILGSFEQLFETDLRNKNFLLTMGDNQIRSDLSEKICNLGGNVPTIIHPTSIISRFASISPIGVYVSAFSYIQADSCIDRDTVILSGVNISHTNKIGKACFIAGGATIGAYTIVGDYAFIGQGALTISSKVRNIGHHAYIGARALITHDVAPGDVVAGIPSRVLKNILLDK